ncbi:Esterase/lipase/thioesterase [Termitomyces sp. Mn162]|nr:Esterase/lipase/thioesterase [Termitomyces sp. Mn162]
MEAYSLTPTPGIGIGVGNHTTPRLARHPFNVHGPHNATDSTIACNDDGSSGALQLTANVVAGSAITAYWNQIWPHDVGPMLTYLAQCPGSTCTGVNAATLEWFKIDEAGLIDGTVYSGTWGSGKMIAQNSSWTTTIPSTVPSGNYLIRFETIALHSLPAQFYPECAQINISGGGSLAPTASQLVKFPGGYSNSDPGLIIDVYSNAAQTETTYPIPGPPLYGSKAAVQLRLQRRQRVPYLNTVNVVELDGQAQPGGKAPVKILFAK